MNEETININQDIFGNLPSYESREMIRIQNLEKKLSKLERIVLMDKPDNIYQLMSLMVTVLGIAVIMKAYMDKPSFKDYLMINFIGGAIIFAGITLFFYPLTMEKV